MLLVPPITMFMLSTLHDYSFSPPVHCHPCMSAMTGIARYFLCVAPNNREGENECGRGPSEPGSDEPEPDLSPNGVARRCPNGQIGLVETPTTARTNLLL